MHKGQVHNQPNSDDSRIRILFVIPSFKTGGAEIQLLSLVRGLNKTRFAVTVAAFYQGNELDADYESIPDTKIVYLNKKSGPDFSFVQRLMQLIRHEHFDIVQCYNISARLLGILSAKKLGVPYTIATERTARLLYSSWGSRFYLFFEKYALRYASLVIANSEAGRQFAISRGVPKARTRVIYNGIDPQRFLPTRSKQEVRQELKIPEKAFVIGLVARIEKLKDPFTFISAAQIVADQMPNAFFVVVGDGPLLEPMRQRVNELTLQQQFTFTGRRSDVADMLNMMNVLVLTSKQVEGCSNSLLEAMALGKAVIATRVGGNVELITRESNGLLVPPQHPQELADAILRVYNDAALRERLERQARQSALENFSQTAMVSSYEAIYHELLPDKAPVTEAKNNTSPFARSNVLGCPVDQMTLDDCVAYFEQIIAQRQPCHIIVVNAAKIVKARIDKELQQIITDADVIGADGVPVVWASKLLGQPLPGRVNGTDLMDRLFEVSAEKDYRVYLLGARQDIITNTVKNLKQHYPRLNIVGYRNGYFDSLQDEEHAVLDINSAQPDILLLGMGTPMKEKWVRRHKSTLRVPIIHGVGGSFDIVGGLTKRAPKWMQDYGLEWFYRFLQEPRRMWRRYLVTNSVFIWLVFRAWISHRLKRRGTNHTMVWD